MKVPDAKGTKTSQLQGQIGTTRQRALERVPFPFQGLPYGRHLLGPRTNLGTPICSVPFYR